MAVPSTTRYEKAIKRNLDELSHAILERRALIGLHNANSAHAWDFFRVAGNALFNDMVSHTIKVFEDSMGASSFWYIERTDQAAMNKATHAAGVSIANIKKLCSGLQHIRDKTHFHIDKGAVFDPQKVWKVAGLTGDDLGTLLDSASRVLIQLYKQKTGSDYVIPEYDGSDAEKIIRSYVKCNPDADVLI